jgi:cation diffusion facilitator CzcD-associated flavoprotein CzcO
MENKEALKTSISKLRVAIIGAGPSGLSQLRAFEAASKKG